jgi:4-hydroxy-tetrahydrodipicolinate reductase
MLRVLHLGLGEIGKGTIDVLLAQSKAFRLAAIADVNPALAGKPLRDVLRRRDVPNLRIAPTLKDALKSAGKIDIATMTTGSRTVDVRDTLEALIRARIHVASTCEELAFPGLRAARIAGELDKKARRAGVAILGTGVNPGFAMDAFALACTAPCKMVRGIRVLRSLDAGKRRQQLQKKVGTGMALGEVQKLIRKGAIGHVGLGESVAMIAAGLGWKLAAIKEKFTPVVAEAAVASAFYSVQPGQVRGMRMTAAGIVAGKTKIELDLTMALGAETYDEVQIDGDPALTIRTTTGFPGDSSTVGILVNAARTLPTLEPGVRTMMDVLRIRSLGV